jgi:hypothetical protein
LKRAKDALGAWLFAATGMMEAKLPDSSGWLWTAAECVLTAAGTFRVPIEADHLRWELHGKKRKLSLPEKCIWLAVFRVEHRRDKNAAGEFRTILKG